MAGKKIDNGPRGRRTDSPSLQAGLTRYNRDSIQNKRQKPPRPLKPLRPDPAPPLAKGDAGSALTRRTEGRLKALGGKVKGVDSSDGYTREEARKVNRARRYQKAGRQRARTLKAWETSPLNPKNNPSSPFAKKKKPTVTSSAPTYRSGDHG